MDRLEKILSDIKGKTIDMIIDTDRLHGSNKEMYGIYEMCELDPRPTPPKPEKPTDPEKPEEPEKPTDPEEPEKPTDPEEPEKPTDPEVPSSVVMRASPIQNNLRISFDERLSFSVRGLKGSVYVNFKGPINLSGETDKEDFVIDLGSFDSSSSLHDVIIHRDDIDYGFDTEIKLSNRYKLKMERRVYNSELLVQYRDIDPNSYQYRDVRYSFDLVVSFVLTANEDGTYEARATSDTVNIYKTDDSHPGSDDGRWAYFTHYMYYGEYGDSKVISEEFADRVYLLANNNKGYINLPYTSSYSITEKHGDEVIEVNNVSYKGGETILAQPGTDFTKIGYVDPGVEKVSKFNLEAFSNVDPSNVIITIIDELEWWGPKVLSRHKLSDIIGKKFSRNIKIDSDTTMTIELEINDRNTMTRRVRHDGTYPEHDPTGLLPVATFYPTSDEWIESFRDAEELSNYYDGYDGDPIVGSGLGYGLEPINEWE